MKKLINWISKHKLLTALAVLAVIGTIIFFRTKSAPMKAYSQTSLESHDLLNYNSFNGTVQSNSEYRIIPSVSSTVTSLSVSEGDHVEKGQVIATLDDTAAQYQIALKQAMMNQSGTSSFYSIRDAETAYLNYKTALENGLNSSMISAGRSLDNSNLAVEHAKDALDNGMDSADSSVSSAKKRAEAAKRTMENAKAALPSDEEAQKIFDEYTEALAEREAALEFLNSCTTAAELARLAYESEPDDSPEKEAKQIAWSEAVAAQTQAQTDYDIANAKYEPANIAFELLTNASSYYETAKKEFDTAQTALANAKTTRSETEDKLEQALESSEHDLAAARLSYDSTALSVQQQLQDYENTIAKIKANANDQSSRIELSHLQDALNDYIIKAPVSGTITSLSMREGEVAANNTPAAVISGLDVMSIKIKIDEYSVINAKEGMPVEIYVDAIKKTYQGTLRYISETADVTEGISYYSAEVDFASDDVVRTGMSTEVRLKQVDHPNAMCLPAEAIFFRTDNTSYVNVKDGSGMKEVDVVTGDTDGLYTEIVQGLSPEDIVLYTASVKLPNSDNVVSVE